MPIKAAAQIVLTDSQTWLHNYTRLDQLCETYLSANPPWWFQHDQALRWLLTSGVQTGLSDLLESVDDPAIQWEILQTVEAILTDNSLDRGEDGWAVCFSHLLAFGNESRYSDDIKRRVIDIGMRVWLADRLAHKPGCVYCRQIEDQLLTSILKYGSKAQVQSFYKSINEILRSWSYVSWNGYRPAEPIGHITSTIITLCQFLPGIIDADNAWADLLDALRHGNADKILDHAMQFLTCAAVSDLSQAFKDLVAVVPEGKSMARWQLEVTSRIAATAWSTRKPLIDCQWLSETFLDGLEAYSSEFEWDQSGRIVQQDTLNEDDHDYGYDYDARVHVVINGTTKLIERWRTLDTRWFSRRFFEAWPDCERGAELVSSLIIEYKPFDARAILNLFESVDKPSKKLMVDIEVLTQTESWPWTIGETRRLWALVVKHGGPNDRNDFLDITGMTEAELEATAK